MDDLARYMLSFEPADIRQHFEGDPQYEEKVAAMSDDELHEIADECLGGDVIYNAFRESLRLAVDDR